MVYLTQIERDWLSAKVAGTTATKPLNQLKREYYISVIGGASSGTKLPELEKKWLLQYITNKGGTPTPNADLPVLWKNVVMTLGVTPTNYLNGNKILFYLNAVIISPSASLSPSASGSASGSASLSPSASASPSP